MLELRTFGGLSVEANGASPTGAAVQRRTLALLALLAAAGRKGLSRDKLIAYLWPETDSDRGRNLLNQACYALRRDLGERDLFLGAIELRLNPAVTTSDLQHFEDALERGDRSGAVRLYAGPFLDGFVLNEANEFERWVEAERARLAQRMSEALESLAHETAERGDQTAAVDWWRRLAQHDPLSARAAVGLMTALDAIGERGEAIRHGQAHAAFVRAELRAEPASEVSTLIRRLQDQPASPGPVASQATETVAAPLLRHARRAHTLSLAAIAGVAVLLAGLAAYPLWGPHEPVNTVAPLGRKMLVVLPFENRGAAADEYFADGLTEAIATRLGGIQRLGVIAWPSASQYKGTRKSPQEIGRELGVQYILAGSVRWDKDRDPSRIRVSPTLIRASDGTQLWADQYDTTLTGVFAVQTKLATRVAGALDIAVMDAERHLLEARPTANLQAYDTYLRARELVEREFDPATVRTAARLYEQAVVLDSSFALAYAWLSVSYVWMNGVLMDRSRAQLTHARAALERALQLDPNLPESHAALGFYSFHVLGENDRALEEYAKARRMRPNDPWFPAVIADVLIKEGHWSEALTYRHEAAVLDPRNVVILLTAALAYADLRQFTAASYYYDRALALRPESFTAQLGKALALLSQTGDLSGAQRLLPTLLPPVDPTGWGVTLVSLFDIATLLDADRQARLLTLTPGDMDGDSIVLALTKALILRANDRAPEARAQFDSARMMLEIRVRQEFDVDSYAAMLGLALAGLGRSADAVREGKRAVDLVPVSKDAEWAGYQHANLARIYVLLGEHDKAIDELKVVLSRPGPLSAGWLRADPFWDPLRESPRFQHLVAEKN